MAFFYQIKKNALRSHYVSDITSIHSNVWPHFSSKCCVDAIKLEVVNSGKYILPSCIQGKESSYHNFEGWFGSFPSSVNSISSSSMFPRVYLDLGVEVPCLRWFISGLHRPCPLPVPGSPSTGSLQNPWAQEFHLTCPWLLPCCLQWCLALRKS